MAINGYHSVFIGQELPETLWQSGRQLLPGQHLQPAAQIAALDAFYNRIPSFDEVRASRIAEDAERSVGAMSGQNSADQLVIEDLAAGSRKRLDFEDIVDVAITLDQPDRSALKVAFSELGFDQQRTQRHVYFGAIGFCVAKGNAWPETELRPEAGWNPQQ